MVAFGDQSIQRGPDQDEPTSESRPLAIQVCMTTVRSTLEPEEKREKAKASHEHMVTRLQDELDRMIKLLSHAREATENELFEGLGYKKLALTDKDLKKLNGLADLAKSVVDTKVKFDKAMKAMADRMTPAEEKAAVVAYLKACEAQDRADIINRIKDWEAKRGNPSPTG